MNAESIIGLAQKKGAEYADAHVVSSVRRAIDVSNKKVKELSEGENKGYGLRVLSKGRWGTAFSNAPDFEKLFDAALANSQMSVKGYPIDRFPSVKKKFVTRVKERCLDRSLEEIKRTLVSLGTGQKEVTNLSINYTDIEKTIEFCNTDGRDLVWKDSICQAGCSSFAKSNGKHEAC